MSLIPYSSWFDFARNANQSSIWTGAENYVFEFFAQTSTQSSVFVLSQAHKVPLNILFRIILSQICFVFLLRSLTRTTDRFSLIWRTRSRFFANFFQRHCFTNVPEIIHDYFSFPWSQRW
jgi:hypothetical protein